ncbi:hemagglutinin repeat-containing protein [Sodalis sp. RH24]|uniref:hemagglutinin repeat-containing protein n=1 Tax=unclassified Sodalis (in: enterobacteria) TaxID=2636512 RepID=UPI0039B67187
MNKQCYCIIFSRSRGELRVVSELARSCGARPGQRRGTGMQRIWITLRCVVWRIGLALFPCYVSAGGIIADGHFAPEQRPEVVITHNGLPQVNINAPNQAGVSHNHFQQFDVGQEGAILNNSAVMTSTQLAGDIPGNSRFDPNVAPASVIINQVNSSDPSQLRGYLEVAGGQAQVIVANPSGILCDGCGTINAGRMTLTTGKPQLNADGTVAGYHVERGLIRIEGSGLNRNARHDTQYVDIMAQAVQVNAGIWAKKSISIAAGRNQINAKGRIIGTLPGGKDKPAEFAIDMGRMGGMYSGHIRMIGTESGVGVRNQGGHLVAEKTLTVSSEGKLFLQSGLTEPTTVATGDITLTARGSVEHSGKLYSGGELILVSRQGKIKQSGTLAAAGDVSLCAEKAIQSSGRLLAGSDASGTLHRMADLTLRSQSVVNASGSLMSLNRVDITSPRVNLKQSRLKADWAKLTATEGVVLKQAHVESGELIVESAGDIDTRHARIRAGRWQIFADGLLNQEGVWLQEGQGKSYMTLSGGLDNTDGVIEARQIGLHAADLNNLRGRFLVLSDTAQRWHVNHLHSNQMGVLSSTGSLELNTVTLNNQAGTLQSLSNLAITAGERINNRHGKMLSGANLTLKSKGNVSNQAGVLEAKQDLIWQGGMKSLFDNDAGKISSEGALSLQGGHLTNRERGMVHSHRELEIDLAGTWENQDGNVVSDGNGNVRALGLINSLGSIQSSGMLVMQFTRVLDNRDGEILSRRAQRLHAETILNIPSAPEANQPPRIESKQGQHSRSVISSQDALTLQAVRLYNRNGGMLKGATSMDVHARELDNTAGQVKSDSSLTLLLVDLLNNRQGYISSTGALDINGGNISLQSLFNSGGNISSGGALAVTAHYLNNTGGRVQSQSDLAIKSRSGINNRRGDIVSKGSINIKSRDIINTQGKLCANRPLRISAGLLQNDQGVINSQDTVGVHTKHLINRDGGIVFSKLFTVVNARELDNTAGRIESAGSSILTLLEKLDNRHGHLVTHGSLTIERVDASGLSLFNQNGNIQSGKALAVTTQSLNNQEGTVQSQLNLEISSQYEINNRQGEMKSGARLGLESKRNIYNQGGVLTAQQDLILLPGERSLMNNDAGKVLCEGTLSLFTDQLLNRDHGLMQGARTLEIGLTGKLDNQGGNLSGGGNSTIYTSNLANSHGKIWAFNNLTMRFGDTLDNRNGNIASQGAMKLKSREFINTQGKLCTNQALRILTDLLQNNQGVITSQDILDVHTRQLTNRDGGIVFGKSRTCTHARELDNTAGRLESAGALTLILQDKLDNRHGHILSHGPLTVQSDDASNLALFNQSGNIQSGGTLAIDAGLLDNQGGNLSGGGNSTIYTSNLANSHGRIRAFDNLSMRFGDTLDNRNGNIASQGAVKLKSREFINTQGKLCTNQALRILTDLLQNNQGVITSQDKLDVHTRQLTNRDGGIVFGKSRTCTHARELDNTAGRLESAGALTLILQDKLDNRHGHILSHGPLTVQSDDASNLALFNQSGNIQSGGTLAIDTGLLDNQGGTLLSQRPLTLNMRQDFIQRNGDTLSSNSAVNLTVSGLLNNVADWLLPGDLTLNSAHFNNLARLVANKLQVSTGVMSNQGRIEAITLNLNLDTLNNNASLTSKSLTVRSKLIENKGSGGCIAATEHLNLQTRERLSNMGGALIHSGGAMYLTSGNVIENRASHIEAGGDITIEAKRLDNLREGLDIARNAEQNDYNWHRYNLYWRSYGSKENTDVNTVAPTTQRLTFRDEHAAGIHPYGTLLNIDTAAQRVEVRVQNHRGELVNLWTHYLTLDPNADGSHNMTFYEMRGPRQIGFSGSRILKLPETSTPTRYHNMFWREHDRGQVELWSPERHIAIADIPFVTDYSNLRERTVNGTVTRDKLVSAGNGASILSGGNMDLRVAGQLMNDASIISARGHLTSGGANITNRAYSINERRREYIVDHYDRDAKHWYPTFNRDETTALSTVDGIINGGGNVTLKGARLENIMVNPAQINALVTGPNTEGFDSAQWVTHPSAVDGAPRAWQSAIVLLPAIDSAFDSNELALITKEHVSGVTTDSYLTPPMALTPTLHAALHNQILSLKSTTGDVAGCTQAVCALISPRNQAGLTGHGALIAGGNLRLSMKTINNIGNLYADRALNIDSRLFNNTGGGIHADSIRLHADSVALNTNLRDALRQASMNARNISISGGDISLQGARLSAEENISLSADNSLSITMARSRTDTDLSMISGSLGNRGGGEGRSIIANPLNKSISAAMTVSGPRMARVHGEWQQALGSHLSAGNDLILQSLHDTTLQGSQASAGGKLYARAGGNIALLADTTTNNTHLQAGGRTSAVRNSRRADALHISTLKGNHGVMILSGKNFVAQGATVDSISGGIALSAQQAIIKEARQQLSESDSERRQEGSGRSQRQIDMESDISLGSVFNDRQGTLVVAGQGDITLQGSEMQSETGAIEMQAAGNISVIASRDKRHFKQQGSSSSKGYVSSKRSVYQIEKRSSTSKGSLLSGQKVVLHSAQNINVLGSNTVACEAISLLAGNDIMVDATENRYQASAASQSQKSGFCSTGGIGFSNDNLRTKTADTLDAVSHTGSTVGARQGDVTLYAGNTLRVQGSDVLAGNAINLAGKDVDILPVANQSTQTHKFELKRSGLSASPFGMIGSMVKSAVSGSVIAVKESHRGPTTRRDIKASLSKQMTAQRGMLQPSDVNEIDVGGVSLSYGKQSRKSEQFISQSKNRGSQLTAGANLNIHATGGDITVRASQLQAGAHVTSGYGHSALTGYEVQSETGILAIKAAGDIVVYGSQDKLYAKQDGNSNCKRLISGSQSAYQGDERSSVSRGSLLSGQKIILLSGGDIKIAGSNAVADQNMILMAKKNIMVEAAQNHFQAGAESQSKTSGLSDNGVIGYRFGNRITNNANSALNISHTGSILGATHGSVTMDAGDAILVRGSELLAGKNINLTGNSIAIMSAENQSTQTQKFQQKWSGLTLALSGAVGSAVNSAATNTAEASKENDNRLAALQGIKAALSSVQAAQSGALAATNANDKNAIGVSLSYGSQSSKSEKTVSWTQSQGSQLIAARDLSIRSTGSDITVRGGRFQAGKDIFIDAARDINLQSAKNTLRVEGKNESKGGSVGIGIGVGQGGWGINVSASINKGSGNEEGYKITHSVMTATSGNLLNISSLRDTTLAGAQLSGETVTMNVGRNLALNSVQDQESYDCKQQSSSAGGSFSFGSMSGSANINLSRDKIHSSYRSVQEQTGIFAGKGGFDITVGEHTQLTGAVIGSTAEAGNNSLTTGTLGFSNIENQADFQVTHQSANFGNGGNIGGQFAGNMANAMPMGNNSNDNSRSITQSAVSEGAITLRNPEGRQDVADLSRDVANAHQTLSPIFDKEKEQRRLREARLIGEIGSQAADVARTQGQIMATQAANEKLQNMNPEDRIAAEAQWRKDYQGEAPSDEYIRQRIYQTAYNEALTESGFGTGGYCQRAIQAATAAVQGLAGGAMAEALVGAGAPYVAQGIHHMTTDAGTAEVNTTANLMAHAALGALVAQVNGNSALAGASGGVIGEYIAQHLYPDIEREDLSEEEKQTISVLSTLAAGLAGGLAGDSSANAVAGAQAGKNAVENNFLSTPSATKRDELAEKIINGDKTLQTAKEFLQLENADKRSDALVSQFKKDPAAMTADERNELNSYIRLYAADMQTQHGDAVTRELVTGLLTGQDYLKSAPNSEAQQKAHTLMKTWGYHTSNASMGDPALMFGLGPLGQSIKMGMLTNAAIGVGANTAVQFSGSDPFSYVDAVMAGVTAAATTGKGMGASAVINMGGAAIGSAAKGENPVGSIVGAGLGSVIGGKAGQVTSTSIGQAVGKATSDKGGAVVGSVISEVVSDGVKEQIDEVDMK